MVSKRKVSGLSAFMREGGGRKRKKVIIFSNETRNIFSLNRHFYKDV